MSIILTVLHDYARVNSMDDFCLTHTITSYECSEDHLMKPEFFLHLC